MDAYLSVVCFNTAEGEKNKMPKPASWADLTKPEYKDSIVMPNPASSGTGYLTIAAWLQIMGEEAGWKFMDELHQNIAQYVHSGSAPCVQAAKGERMIGIGFDMRGATEKTKGAPIELILPKEGLGWDMEATAIVKGTKNLDGRQEARRLGRQQEGQRALRQVLSPSSAMPGVKPTCRRTIRPTSRRRWSRTTSNGWRRTATASWPSGPSATTASRRRRSDPRSGSSRTK